MNKREKVSVEILDFISPDANRKSLFITGIPYMTEEELVVSMRLIFRWNQLSSSFQLLLYICRPIFFVTPQHKRQKQQKSPPFVLSYLTFADRNSFIHHFQSMACCTEPRCSPTRLDCSHPPQPQRMDRMPVIRLDTMLLLTST